MEWRMRPCGHGGFVAEYGSKHEGGVLSHTGIGYTMPAFIVYRSAHFNTEKQAQRYIARQK
ncbi:MAG: hypothetical protein ACI4GX_02915 [Ruminococcus sp.]|uniref:hypothetical protein n=1 Tax=Ruminococcus sp. TaxID=41978 RepID=UPI003EFEF099